jgi:branched-chain amino acid transport system permease protein
MALPIRVDRGSWQHWAGRVLLFGGVALFLFRAQSQWSRSGLGLLTDALIIAIAVTALNLITGYTGQLSLGHAAFFAIGAYISAMLVTGKVTTPFFDDNEWSAGWTLPVAAVACFAIGCLVGVPALRLRGIYLALVTIVFVEAVRATLKYDELENITGGPRGLDGLTYLPPSWTGLNGRQDLVKWFFYLAVFFLVVATLLASGLLRSRMGRAMVATRDNATAAAVMGVNLAVVKTMVFGISGAMAGVAGSLYALKLGLVEPDIPVFGLAGSITLLVALVVGGAAQQWGPLVGAMFYVFVNDFARTVGEKPDDSLLLGWLVGPTTKIDGLGGVTFGILLILFARFVPFGAVGTLRMGRSKIFQVVPKPPTTGPGGRLTAIADGEPTTVIGVGIGSLDAIDGSDTTA